MLIFVPVNIRIHTNCLCPFLLQMLRLQKVLQVKTHLRSMLESSRLRLLREFGADNKATEHVRAALPHNVTFSSLKVFTLRCS